MRVYFPPEQMDDPAGYLMENYGSSILVSGIAFSTEVYRHSTLSLREFEGARARTAEINGCRLCQQFRAERDLPGYLNAVESGSAEQSILANGDAPDEAYYRNVSNWKSYDGYSDRERLAIRYAEGMGLDPQRIAQDENFWQQAKAVFSDSELVELAYSIGCWMGLGRASHVLGMDAVCAWMPTAEQKSDSLSRSRNQ